MGYPNSSSYAASKAFVNSLAEGLWGELSPLGIDVVALCPGSTDTEALDLQGVDRSKLDAMMSPEQVAKESLANIGEGPVYIVGSENRQKCTALGQIPRKEILVKIGQAMKQALLQDDQS